MSGRSQKPTPRGRLVEIGEGRALHVVLEGPEPSDFPLVVLEAGAFGFSADWSAVQAKLALIGMRSMALRAHG